MTHFARGSLLRSALSLLDQMEAGTDKLLADVGLDRKELEASNTIRSVQEFDFFELAGREVGRPDFGLIAGAAFDDNGTFGTMGTFVAHCRNMAHVIEEGARYTHFLNSAISYSLVNEDQEYALRTDFLTMGRFPQTQFVEAMQVVGLRFIRAILGDEWLPARASFQHARVAPLAAYRKHLGVTPEFSAPMHALYGRAEEFERPLNVRETQVNQYIETFLNAAADEAALQPNLPKQVRSMVHKLLQARSVTSEEIAKALNMTPRTLQRRLSEHGTTLKKIVNEAREEIVKEILPRDKLTGDQVAMKLGFSEASAASRFVSQHWGKPMRELKIDRKKSSRKK